MKGLITLLSIKIVIIAGIFMTVIPGFSDNTSVAPLNITNDGQDDFELLNTFNVPTSSGQTLDVTTDAGSVKVTKGSSSSTVVVKVYGDDVTKDRVDYSAGSYSSGVKVTGKVKDQYRDSHEGWNIKLKFEIEVPADYDVTVKTGGGAISIEDVDGTKMIKTGGGAIKIGNTNGRIEVNTGGGAVKIENNTGDISINTGGGAVRLDGFSGNVEINTGGGSVSMNGSNGKIDVTTGGGSIALDYSGSNYGIDLNTGGGSISVDIPSDFSADVNLSTNVGGISTNFGSPDKNGIGSKLKTTINGGGERLECHTGAGSISVSMK